MVVFDNDDTLLIKTNCDQKFRFFCNFMANCVKVSQNYFNNIACPSKVTISDSIEKSSINISVDPLLIAKSSINIVMDPLLNEKIKDEYFSCPINFTYSYKCIEYGLVLYEHRKLKSDIRWSLENLIKDFKKNHSLRDSYCFVGQNLSTMINDMIKIRSDNFDKDETRI